MVRTSLTTAVVAALAVSLSGCGGGTTKAPGTESTVATQSTTTPPTPSPTLVEYKQLDKARLSNALLGLDTMPPGYSLDPPDNSPETPVCGKKSIPGKLDVEHWFTKGGGLTVSLIKVGLREYGSSTAARTAFDETVSRISACKHETRSDGEKTSYSPMSTEHVGEATFGVRVEFNEGTVIEVFALQGPAIISVGGGGTVEIDTDSVLKLIRQQTEEYTAAATAS
jgi:hypothetical protein